METLRSLRGQVNRFRAKTGHGALIELAQLAQEKARLCEEMKRWEKRIKQIQSRLEEIDKMKKWLYGFVDGSQAPSAVTLRGKKSSPQVPPGCEEMNIRY
jgi:uncharacterized protein (DUF305 family)